MERTGFKVVTENMQSLGLRRNPNILTYPVGEWYSLPQDWIVEGKSDWGGIWVAKNKGGANTLKKYFKYHYKRNVLVFEAKIKTVFLVQELV